MVNKSKWILQGIYPEVDGCISWLARGDLSGGGTLHSITDEAGGIGHLKKEIALKYLLCWNYNPIWSYLRAISLPQRYTK